MAANDQSALQVQVWENEWRWPSGWRDVPQAMVPGLNSVTSGAPVPVIPSWSDARGVRALHPVTLPPPHGFVWAQDSEWAFAPSAGATDEQGWTYGRNMAELLLPVVGGADDNEELAFWPGPARGKASWDKTCSTAARRRQWLRKAVPAEGAVAASTAASSSVMAMTPVAARRSPSPAASASDRPTPALSPALPLRGAREAADLATLSADVARLTRVISALRRAPAALGGPGDSETQRQHVRRLLTEVRARAAALEECALFNSRSAAAATAAATRLTAVSPLAALSSAPRSNAAAPHGPRSPASSPASGVAGSGGSPFDSRLEGMSAFDASGAGLGATPPPRHEVGTPASAAADARRWERLVADVRRMLAAIAADSDAYAARCAQVPLALAGGGGGGRGGISSNHDAMPIVLEPALSSGGAAGPVAWQAATADRQSTAVAATGGDAQAQLLAEVDFTASLVEERNEAIDSVTRDVAQVAELFRDLHGLVVDQGAMLDIVEKNVDNAAASAEKGVEHLREADKIDRSGRCVVA